MIKKNGDITIRKDRAGYILRTEQIVHRSIDDVFSFFSDAHNLDLLTPSRLKFRILTPNPIEMRRGTLIDYRLRLRGFPIKWQSEITVWEPPHRFVDEQRRGPYRSWRHEHLFEGFGDHTIVKDIVNYSVPGGQLVHKLWVEPDLRKIFEFRSETIATYFS